MRWVCLAAVVLLLPVVARADSVPSVTSSDTVPGEWRIWNDTWHNRTTFLGDSGTVRLALHAPAPGTYRWVIPGGGDPMPGLPNPLSHLFSSFLVRGPGGLLGELALENASAAFVENGTDLNFTLDFTVASLAPSAYSDATAQSAAILEAENREWPQAGVTSHPGEVVGFLRLQQLSSSGSCNCTSVVPLVERDFSFVFHLAGTPFSFRWIPAAPARVGAWVSGSSYEANGDVAGRIMLAGNLTTGLAVEGGPRLAALTTSGAALLLPAGRHRLLYEPSFTGPGEGTVTLAVRAGSFTDTLVQPTAWPSRILAGVFNYGWVALPLLLLWPRRYRWRETKRGELYVVEDRRGRRPPRLHHGRAPPWARVTHEGAP
ncbi:MAG: hypothetical protein ACYDBQ_01120 [Thermoplasmatota archaeon]